MTSKSGPSRGSRLRQEVPLVPDARDLSDLDATAQRALRGLVAQAGGRFDSNRAIPVGHMEVLALLLDAWGRRHAEPTVDGFYFAGRPGLWHALDELYPLQDPNRWDQLRKAVVMELEKGSWRRRRPPRGSSFDISA